MKNEGEDREAFLPVDERLAFLEGWELGWQAGCESVAKHAAGAQEGLGGAERAWAQREKEAKADCEEAAGLDPESLPSRPEDAALNKAIREMCRWATRAQAAEKELQELRERMKEGCCG